MFSTCKSETEKTYLGKLNFSTDRAGKWDLEWLLVILSAYCVLTVMWKIKKLKTEHMSHNTTFKHVLKMTDGFIFKFICSTVNFQLLLKSC